MASIFDWLDSHPEIYWLLAVSAAVIVVAQVSTLAAREARGRKTDSGRSAWWDALLLFLFLLAWRWPFLLCAAEYNPDESQFIAGAITLMHDPVFWRSVDGTTSGPLNFYVLLPLHLVGLPLDYFTARLVGLLLIWGTLLASMRTLAAVTTRGIAWIAVLPAAGFYGTMFIPDFIHYSSEHLPVCMLAVACWLLARRNAGERARLWLACALAGSTPWAKLQAGPIAAVLVGWALWQVWREKGDDGRAGLRGVGGVFVASLLPTVVVFALASGFGVAGTLVDRYLAQNLFYVEEGRSMAEALRMMWGFSRRDGRFPLFLVSVVLAVAAVGVLAIHRRVRPPALAVVASSLLGVSIVAIVTPHREYLHYVLFLVVPFTLLLGALAGACWGKLASTRGRLVLAAALIGGVGLPPLVTRLFQPTPDMFGAFLDHWRRPRTPMGELLHELSGGEGSLAIWGWVQSLYVESGLPQATRDPISFRSMLPGPLQEYFRRDYLADFRRNRPALFVDVSGPEAFLFTDREKHGHETFPGLAAEVRENYALVRDGNGGRIYLREDLAAARKWTAFQLDAIAARGRAHDGVPAPDETDSPPDWRIIDARRMLMLLPPARAQWGLEEDVRQVALDYGVQPRAYQEGNTDGVALVVELVEGAEVRAVFQRLLDPAHQLADRGRQSVVLSLPPFSAGARLVVRSDPGPHGDSAWDWLYLARLSRRSNARYNPEQFPEFNRVPADAYAPRSVIVQREGQRTMDVHVPARFRFVLTGDETRVRFEYGLLPAAYEGEARTDGATFRVELARRGGDSAALFERHVDPLANEPDRGAQIADVRLPAVDEGDVLTIALDAGPRGSDAWDWTFFRKLKIE